MSNSKLGEISGFGEIAESLRRSTVQVAAGRRGQGSGIVVRPEGTIVTNAHVAASDAMHVRLWDGRSFPAALVTRDPGRDLAILQIHASGLPAATLANSDELRVGEIVIAVGNPLGFMGALTTGIVHAIGHLPGLGAMKWIQADVQLAPGNSGGPLADAHGRVVGVNTMVAGRLGLAVPSNSVRRALNRGFAPPPMGVVIQPAPLVLNGKQRLGLAIVEVKKPSAADAASLRAGDILIGVQDRELHSIEDLEAALEGSGERVIRVQFIRGNQQNVRTVALRLGVPDLVAA